MKRAIGLLLYMSYRLQYHYLFQVSLRNWLWALVVVPPVAGALGYMRWSYAILLVLLGASLLAGAEWSRRRGYLIFTLTSPDESGKPQSPIEVDEQIACRASGVFAVGKHQRYLVNERAWVSHVRTREHVVMARLDPTRFLLFARSLGTDAGWWYVFFMPQHVLRVQRGRVLCGLRSHPGLAICYRPAERVRQEETVYLAFNDEDTLQRVLNDMRRDVEEERFQGAAGLG